MARSPRAWFAGAPVLGDSVRRRLGARRARIREEEAEPEPRAAPRRRWKVWIPATLGALVVPFGIGYLVAVTLIYPPPAVTEPGVAVPDVVGETVARAQARLRGMGLEVDAVDLPNPVRPPGVITAQVPLPGQQLRTGAAVRVAVSSGPARVLVPDVTGFSAERANALLTSLGFEVERTDRMDPAPAGRVLAVDPAPGSEHRLPARIMLIVSLGPPVDTATYAPDTAPWLLRPDTSAIRRRTRDTARDTMLERRWPVPR